MLFGKYCPQSEQAYICSWGLLGSSCILDWAHQQGCCGTAKDTPTQHNVLSSLVAKKMLQNAHGRPSANEGINGAKSHHLIVNPEATVGAPQCRRPQFRCASSRQKLCLNDGMLTASFKPASRDLRRNLTATALQRPPSMEARPSSKAPSVKT